MDNRSSTDMQAAPRRWPVRLILVGIVFALVLPALVFSVVLANRIATAERATSQAAAMAAALRAAEALDREIGNLSGALLALSTSPSLSSGDLAAFDRQASRVALSLGQELVLCDLDGNQLLNTRRPFGARLPHMAAMDTLHRVIETRVSAVSDLLLGATTGEPTVIVMYPVVNGGDVTGVFAMSVQLSYLSGLLQKQGLPAGWIATVVDSNNRVVARSVDADRFVGQVATRDLAERPLLDRDLWIARTLEGTPVLAATQRLRLASWRVAIGVPLATIDAPLNSTLMLIGSAGTATLAIAILLAWKLAKSVTVPLQRLARAGSALGQGLPVLGVRSAIAEVDAVSGALVRATQDLRARADALAAERAQLAAVIETVPVGLVIAEAPIGRIVSGNSKLEEMLRHKLIYSDSDADYGQWVSHHPDGRLVRPDEYPLAQVLHGAAHAELQCIYRRGDGTPLWVQFVAAPILDANGAITGGVVAALDIDEVVRAREEKARSAERLEAQVVERTAALEAANQRLRDEIGGRAAAEEQLRQAQKMEAVGQLTGGIAHDFNNLLTIVIGSLDLLRRRAPDDRNKRLVDNAMEGATRAATLTARLLAFSRRQPLMPQPVDLNALVAGMSDLLLRTLGEGMQVQTALAPAVWQTHADPNQLENALLNLAVNGRDAITGAGRGDGRLVIATADTTLDSAALTHDPEAEPGDYVMVSVQDNGTGILPEVAARVFEPFYTTKPQGQGTGLGLSQVHGFVKQSGGHIAIETALGVGTIVRIYLPRFRGEGVAAAAPEPADTPAQPALTVLVVEDDDGVRHFSAEALRDLGHIVLEADRGAAALDILDAHPEVALMITDVLLPMMDGPRLAEAARRKRPDLPVLFASGYTGSETRRDELLPADATLLQKPFTVHALGAKLQEVLGLRPAGLEPATKPL